MSSCGVAGSYATNHLQGVKYGRSLNMENVWYKDSPEDIKTVLEKQLNLLASQCKNLLDNASKIQRYEQQKEYDKIQGKKIDFIQILYRYIARNKADKDDFYKYLQALLLVTYNIDKLATMQTFGIVNKQSDIPEKCIDVNQIKLKEGNMGSTNEVKPGLLNNKEVFYKNLISDVAQLEIYSAELFRQMLGSASSHGKTVHKDGKINGMYVEKIPGFISMKELCFLASKQNPYAEIDKKISELGIEISNLASDVSYKNMESLSDKNRKRTAYLELKKMRIFGEMGNEGIDIKKLNKIVAKILCSSFYFEDWDRHKDNWGVSCINNELRPACLDYDKSLSGTFMQDNKIYDWDITPQKLKNFPEFKCWYWPTQSSDKMKWLASFWDEKMASRMYGTDESMQYMDLKNDVEFRKQSYIEWLKLAMIPQKARSLRLDFVSKSADKKLLQIPSVFEGKRKTLVNSLVQVDEFRKIIGSSNDMSSIFVMVRSELESTLDKEELNLVNESWDNIKQEIEDKSKKIDHSMEMLKSYPLLYKLIKESGIAVDSGVYDGSAEKFSQELQSILLTAAECDSEEEFCKTLNSNLGLSIDPKNVKLEYSRIVDEINEVTVKEDITAKLIDKLLPFALPQVQIGKFKESLNRASYREKKFLLDVIEQLHGYAYKKCEGITEDEKFRIYLQLLSEFLRGGQVHFDDGGKLYEAWHTCKLSDFDSKGEESSALASRDGLSSHQSDDPQFSIRGNSINEGLFGTRTFKNGKKHTWLQLESHSTGITNLVGHLLAYVEYKMTGHNVGQYGNSKYKEIYPLDLSDTRNIRNELLQNNPLPEIKEFEKKKYSNFLVTKKAPVSYTQFILKNQEKNTIHDMKYTDEGISRAFIKEQQDLLEKHKKQYTDEGISRAFIEKQQALLEEHKKKYTDKGISRAFIKEQQDLLEKYKKQYTDEGVSRAFIKEQQALLEEHKKQYTDEGISHAFIEKQQALLEEHKKKYTESGIERDFIEKQKKLSEEFYQKYNESGMSRDFIEKQQALLEKHKKQYTDEGISRAFIEEQQALLEEHKKQYTEEGISRAFIEKQQALLEKHKKKYTEHGIERDLIEKQEKLLEEFYQKYNENGMKKTFMLQQMRLATEIYLDSDVNFEQNVDKKLKALFLLIDPLDNVWKELDKLLAEMPTENKEMLFDVFNKLYVCAYKDCENISDEERLYIYGQLLYNVLQGSHVNFKEKYSFCDKWGAKKSLLSIETSTVKSDMSWFEHEPSSFALMPSKLLQDLSDSIKKKIFVEKYNKYTKHLPIDLSDQDKIKKELLANNSNAQVKKQIVDEKRLVENWMKSDSTVVQDKNVLM